MISRALMVWASLFDLKNVKSTQTVLLLFEILDEISILSRVTTCQRWPNYQNLDLEVTNHKLLAGTPKLSQRMLFRHVQNKHMCKRNIHKYVFIQSIMSNSP